MRGVETLDPDWRAFQEDGSTFAPTSAPATAALQTGRAQTNLIVGIDKPDGTLTWISLSAHPLVCDGRPAAAITTLTEVTERRRAEDRLSAHQDRWQRDVAERQRAEEELRQRNRYIETILERAPIGFAVHTIDDGVGRFVSARFEEILRRRAGAIDSHFTFFEKVWPRDAALRAEIRRRVVVDMSKRPPLPACSGRTSRSLWP